MALWIVLPIIGVGVAAKKLYNFLSEDDKPIVKSSHATRLGGQKGRRTRARKAKIHKLVKEHRENLRRQVDNLVKEKKPILGEIIIDDSDPHSWAVSFPDLDCAIHSLQHAELLFTSNCYKGNDLIGRAPYTIDLKQTDDIVKIVLAKANNEFGDMAGIGPDDQYRGEDDPFLVLLRTV